MAASLTAGALLLTHPQSRAARATAAETGGLPTEVSMEVDARKTLKDIGRLKRGILVSSKTSDYAWNKYVNEVGVKGALVRLPLDFEYMRGPEVLDPLIEKVRAAGGEPLISLGGIPTALSRPVPRPSARVPIRRRFDVTPENLATWRDLIRQAVLHYNRDKGFKIKYLEVWNEPDLPLFWSGTQEEFFGVYRATVEGARSADPAIRVGGPATSSWSGGIGQQGPLIKNLLEFARRQQLPVDFVSWHAFEKEPSLLRDAGRGIQAWKATFGFPDAELFLDEWNFGPPSLEREGPIGAAFAGTMMAAIFAAGIDRHAFAMLQDVDTARADFSGDDYGLFTLSGIGKPVYNALRAVSMLGDVRVESSQRGGEQFVTSVATRGDDGVAVLISHFPPQDPLARAVAFFFHELGYTPDDLRRWGVDDRTVKELLKPEGDKLVDGLRAPEKAKADLKRALKLYRRLEQETVLGGGRWRVRLTVKNLPFQSRFVYERYVIDGRNGNGFAVRDKIGRRLATLEGEARARALEAVERLLTSAAVRPASRGPLLGLLAAVKAADPTQAGKLVGEFRRKNSGAVVEDLGTMEALFGKTHAEHMRGGLDEINEWPEVGLTRTEASPQSNGGEFATAFHVQPYSVTLVLLRRQGERSSSRRSRF